MRKLTILIVTVILLASACSTSEYQQRNSYTTISVEQIFNSLPASSIAVGFDVDDTVLFSSPAFYYVAYNKDGTDGSNIYGTNPFARSEAWADINNKFDKFSLPKKIASRLIKMHLAREDKVYFITAREPSTQEQLTSLLKEAFQIPNMQPVIFVGHNSKAEPLSKHDIQLFYGDSDSDIREAKDAGVRAIRILRAGNSTDPRKLDLGGFGEPILINSEF